MGLAIGAMPDSMAKEFEAHLAMANGPATVHVLAYRIDPASGEPAESDTDTSGE